MRGPWKLSSTGCDRATAYHMSNKVVRRGEELFVTWLESDYRNVVAAVDPASGAVRGSVAVAQGFDNHCGAALALTPDGNLHVMNGSHHRGFVYRRSATPAEPLSWSPPEAVGCRPTYPSLVSDLQGNLHLAHRCSMIGGTRWGTACMRKEGANPWRTFHTFAEAPAPGYTYPTNTLALGPDGTIHLVIEWYKTYVNNVEPAHSAAVSHFESPDGVRWLYSDGREVKSWPIGLEDSDPILFRGRGNLRAGNVTVLPDGRPCVCLWDAAAQAMLLAVRGGDRAWRVTDLSPAVEALCPGTFFNGPAQVAATPRGELLLVFPRCETAEWSHVSTRHHLVRLAPDSGKVLHHEAILKTDPAEPDWLASIEKPVLGRCVEDPYLLFTTGRAQGGCVNAARCAINLVHLT